MSRTVAFEHEPTGCGLGVNEDVVIRIEALDGKDILSLSGNRQCDNNVLITTRDGTVLFNKANGLQCVPWQNCVELESKNISFIDSSDNYHVGLNVSGDVFTWKDGDADGSQREESIYLPMPKMLNLSLKVVQISCGKRHTVCLTEEGRIGVWGSNSEGQLGLGRQARKLYTEPQFIDCLKGVMFVQVIAGGYHTMALSGSSAVFGWGRNSSRQLGTTRKDKQIMGPVSCRDIRSKRIKFISCGENHTAMLSTEGNVFSFGLNFEDGNEEIPHGEILCLRDKPVSAVACGFHNTVTFVAETGQAFVFGRGQKAVSLAHLVEELGFRFEKDIEKSCSRGFALFTAYNRTFLHVSRLPRRDGVREATDKMLLLERIKSDSPQDRSDEYLKKKLMASLSSSSCLNGSFLSGDTRHCECSRLRGHGIDMETVRPFFRFLKDECLSNDSVSTTVEKAMQKLLSELPDEPCHIEALRLYLVVPFCHLMDDGSVTFLEPFVNSWIGLNKDCQKILNQWLKTLPVEYFKRYVEVLTKSVCELLPKFKDKYRDAKTIMTGVQSSVRVMDKLYKINEERGDQVPWQEFYVPELFSTVDIQEDYILSLKDLEQNHESFRFCKFPFLYNPESKEVLLMSYNKMAKINADLHVLGEVNRQIGHNIFQSPLGLAMGIPALFDFEHMTVDNKLLLSAMKETSPFIPELTVSRERILEETRQKVESLRKQNEHMHKMELRVTFEGEEAAGQGVYQEFFTLLFDRLLEQDLFQNEEESNLLWFKPLTSDGLQLLKFVGFMLGLAVYNGKLVNLQFPLAVYKKLLDVPVTFADFEELKPGVAKLLKECILGEEIIGEHYFDDVVEMELCENGDERLVTHDNKQEFIDLKVDLQLNKNIEQEFEHFRQGFFEACDKTVLRELKFQPIELRAVIVGKEKIDLTELKRTVKYEAGYQEDHPVIVNLWEVLTAMEIDDQKLFIRFITGTERIPHGGLDLEIRPLEKIGEKTDDLIPVVATCSNVLFIPSIADPERLKNRLYQAIGSKENIDKNRFTSLTTALGGQP